MTLTADQVRAIFAAESAQPEEIRALAQHWIDSEQTLVILQENQRLLLQECAEKRAELDELQGIIR